MERLNCFINVNLYHNCTIVTQGHVPILWKYNHNVLEGKDMMNFPSNS